MKKVLLLFATLGALLSCSEGKDLDGSKDVEHGPYIIESGDFFCPSHLFVDEYLSTEPLAMESNERGFSVLMPDRTGYVAFCLGEPGMSSNSPFLGVVDTDEFWYPDSYKKNDVERIGKEFHDVFSAQWTELFPQNGSLLTALLETVGEITIVSDKVLFNEAAGTDLSAHFKICHFRNGGITLRGYPFELVYGDYISSLAKFVESGNMLDMYFILFTEEPFEGPVDLTIEIPVKKVKYLSYLRDLRRDANAQLQREPMTLRTTFTLYNAKQ
jgi:hypothetical protein